MSDISIREAIIDDAGLILEFIVDLASYEKATEHVFATEEEIEQSIFGAGSTTHGIICEINGTPVGFAVFFFQPGWERMDCIWKIYMFRQSFVVMVLEKPS